ncbi:UNVERIFIED_CONTAM: hypothetical protein FKN15_066936 [Acipenser sinensis]
MYDSRVICWAALVCIQVVHKAAVLTGLGYTTSVPQRLGVPQQHHSPVDEWEKHSRTTNSLEVCVGGCSAQKVLYKRGLY